MSNKSQIKGTVGRSRGGQLFLCLIGMSLVMIGGVFGWLMLRSYQHAKLSREWPQVEVLVLRSGVDERSIPGSPREYRLNVLYGYSFGGNDISTNQYAPRGAKWSENEAAAQELQRNYSVGSTHTAWVNPVRPEMAILKHDSKAAGYTLWFPALFVIAGGGMMWGALSKKRGV